MRTQRSGRGLHNVPAELTSFFGRRGELAEIKQRLGGSRPVTLTGTGGVGKTRLALRAASEVEPHGRRSCLVPTQCCAHGGGKDDCDPAPTRPMLSSTATPRRGARPAIVTELDTIRSQV